MKAQLQAILKVIKLAELLKIELRHSYTSSGRQESVAEHTWRMALMAGYCLTAKMISKKGILLLPFTISHVATIKGQNLKEWPWDM